MLDFRIATFLKLCETRSYTNTAKILHITQPSVTQHIKYLQKRYDCQLFSYEGKNLRLTPEGEYLRRQATAMTLRSEKVLEDIRRMSTKHRALRFGCTKAYGETLVPQIIARMMAKDDDLELTMCTENTVELLNMLEGGKLDFILVDKSFDKNQFESFELGKDKFCGWASPQLADALSNVSLKKLFREKLLIREEGSGSRMILERILDHRNCDIDDFYAAVECNSSSSITELTKAGVGVSFGFASCMKDELKQKTVQQLSLADLAEERDIVFMYLKDNMYPEHFKAFFKSFKKEWDALLAE